MTSKAGASYTYGTQSASCPDGALSKPHAVVAAGSDSFCYDPNGNMVRRSVGGSTYNLSYDAENCLVGVSGAASAAFVYGPRGERVKGTVGSTDRIYVGNHYEIRDGSTIFKYYYADGTRVAERKAGTLYWLLSDHLGSTSIVAYSGGGKQGEVRYTAWGEDRYTDGSVPTTYHYTGQRSESYINMYYYGARWYDPALGRFVQADTVVPDGEDPQALNRYAYTANNPVKFCDPSGHCWGAFSFVRGLPSYDVTCANLDMALTIVKHPDVDVKHKIGAGAYIAAEGVAHATAIVTGGFLAYKGVAALTAGGLGLEAFDRAKEFGIDTYRNLRKLTTGQGLEVHHIIEQRFADILGISNPKDMLSVALTPEEHQVFINAWRNMIGYANDANLVTSVTATIEDIWAAAQIIYADYPDLLEAARQTIFGP